MSRIFVVDDDKIALKVIRRIFMDQDYEMEMAQSGQEAVERIPRFKPDLVILDVTMPGMSGYEVCRQLKSNEQTAGTMVLLLSGRIDLEDRLKGYEMLADDYLTKPYEPPELLAKVKILLRLKTTRDEIKKNQRES